MNSNLHPFSCRFIHSSAKRFVLVAKTFGAFQFTAILLLFGIVYPSHGQKVSLPDIKAGVSGAITCVNTSVKLQANSKTPGVYFTWSGPMGFHSTGQSPATAIPGDYKLSVTDPLSGGTSTAVIRVVTDTLAPAGVKIAVSGALTCADTIVMLKGNSSTPEAAFTWQGPKGLSLSGKNVATTQPGAYKITVINPVNGCKALASAVVEQNVTRPAGVTAIASGILTCKVKNVVLTGMSDTKNAQFSWTGAGFTSAEIKPEVSMPGKYVLKVTDPANGCSSLKNVEVKGNTNPPQVIARMSDTLNCKKAKTTLSVSSDKKGVLYAWSGPGAFVSVEPSFETGTPGNFTVNVTDPESGCSATKTITVVRDTLSPSLQNISASGTLSCTMKTVELKSSSVLPALLYQWSGPDNFKSVEKSPVVKVPGKYVLTAINPVNGCISKANVTVSGNACTEK